MNLDELARNASEELLSRATTNADAMLADLRRIRTRRSLIRSAALVAALALVVGGIALARADHRAVGPTHDGSAVTNGALVISDVGTVSVIDGSLAIVPADAAQYSPLAFTPDGSELIYVRRGEDLVAMNVTTGQTRALAHCPNQLCWVALSPDGTRLAVPAEVGGEPGLCANTPTRGWAAPQRSGRQTATRWPSSR